MQEINNPQFKTKSPFRVNRGQGIAYKQEVNVNNLYEKHAAKLLGIIIGIVGCPIKANDILLKTFLKAKSDFKLLQEFKFNEFTWLFNYAVKEMAICLPENDKINLKQKIINLIKKH